MEDLTRSIQECGYVETIAINLDNTILSGHARKKVLLAAGITEVDVRVPERMLTEKEAEAVLIRMNKNIAGEFDFEILANEYEISELVDMGFEPYEIGITLEDIQKAAPGLPAIGERISNEIVVSIKFETQEAQAEFLGIMPECTLLHKVGDYHSYKYPATGRTDSAAFEWK